MIQYRYGNLFGIEQGIISQYHKVNERSMAHVRPSLRRIKTETEKQIKLKLTGISEIREYDRASHSAKVEDKKKRRFYISLMLGNNLYLDEFSPYSSVDKVYYVIAGLRPSTFILSASILKGIFQCIPKNAYDYCGNRCRVSKADFLSGVHKYASLQEKTKAGS